MQVQTRTHPVAATGIQETLKWPLWQLISFRFAFLYLGLYNFTAIEGWVPDNGYVFKQIQGFWHAVVPWVGQNILHLGQPITIFNNGSGDTTYEYVHVLCFLLVAIIGTALWSLLDNKRYEYERLTQWLRLYIRIALAVTFIGYGMSKLDQFPTPSFSVLIESYGQSSPMTLLWTFMGASRTYCIFAGCAEVLAGVLLMLPELTTLGALVGAAVMTNVFMLNMCYDVPVKLYSFHLLLMCLFLLLPEFPRLINFFLLNKPAVPLARTEFFQNNLGNRIMAVLQILVCCYFVYMPLSYRLQAPKQQAQANLFSNNSIWLVDNFLINGQMRPPLITDNDRWQRICISQKTFSIQYTNGKTLVYGIACDRAHKTVSISERNLQTTSDGDQLPENVREQAIGTLTYAQPASDQLVFDGTLADKQIHTTLHQLKEPQFLLLSRGFHWIQEYPFDR